MPNRRTDRLFEILQMLRGGRCRTAKSIAEELGVSERSVYRDIDALILSGMPIRGRRGHGYEFSESVFLPPLTLTTTELEALKVGAEFVSRFGDDELSAAANELVVKLKSVVPERVNQLVATRWHTLYNPPLENSGIQKTLRKAVSTNSKVRIEYTDLAENQSERTIWPLQLEFWGAVWTCSAWCEMKEDFRVFRVDRVSVATTLEERYPSEPGKTYGDFVASMEATKSDS